MAKTKWYHHKNKCLTITFKKPLRAFFGKHITDGKIVYNEVKPGSQASSSGANASQQPCLLTAVAQNTTIVKLFFAGDCTQIFAESSLDQTNDLSGFDAT